MIATTGHRRSDGPLLAGVDEVGRGPLAGPVVAAAVILDPAVHIEGLADSKLLSEARRASLDARIREKALAWALGRAEATEIDQLNILEASLVAMRRAVFALPVRPRCVLIDGRHSPELFCAVETVIKGDRSIPAISAASIVAKVARDHEMTELDQQYPGYGFDQHKGYPTRMHLEALARRGVTPIHRRSFSPVRKCLELT